MKQYSRGPNYSNCSLNFSSVIFLSMFPMQRQASKSTSQYSHLQRVSHSLSPCSFTYEIPTEIVLNLNGMQASIYSIYYILISMGSLCSQTNTTPSFFPTDFVYGEEQTPNPVIYSPLSAPKEVSAQAFRAIQTLKQRKSLYKDPYPIEPSTLQSKSSDTINCIFLRASSFQSTSFPSSSSHILTNNDTEQYVSMFLCFLADNPTLIPQLHYSHPSGLNIVKVKNEYLYMDDYILCDAVKGSPVFTPANGLWPCMVEKAWMRRQSFDKIYKQSPVDVFEAFLSYPVSKIKLTPTAISTLTRWNKDYAYVLLPKRNSKALINLGDRPYYYLFHTVQNGENLFYMRDPSCKAIRNSFHKLSQNLKKAVRDHVKDEYDGNFFLTEDQLYEQIDEIMICSYNPQVKTLKQQVFTLQQNKQKFIGFTLKTESEVGLTVRQEGSSCSPITYQVFDLDGNRVVAGEQNIQGCYGARNINLFANSSNFAYLKRGSYLIRLKSKASTKVHLLPSSSSQFIFDFPSQTEWRKQFKKILIQKGQEQLRIKGETKIRSDFDHSVCWIGDLLLIYIKKINTKVKEIGVQVSFPQLVNLKSVDPIGVGSEFKVLPLFEEDTFILFEKIQLTRETKLSKYFIERI